MVQDDYHYIQKSADILNLLIQRAATTAVGTTASAGQAGQKVTVNLGDVLGSIQGVCLGSVVPGPVEARKAVDGTWYIMSPYEPIQVAQVRRIRRAKGADPALATFAFLYVVRQTGKLWIGGPFFRKEVQYEFPGTLFADGLSGLDVAGYIQHSGQSVAAVFKFADTLLSIPSSGIPTAFSDPRIPHLLPISGGAWIGTRTVLGQVQSSSSLTETSSTSIQVRQVNIDIPVGGIREFVVDGVLGTYILIGDASESAPLGNIIFRMGVPWLEGWITFIGSSRIFNYRTFVTSFKRYTTHNTRLENRVWSYLYHQGTIEESELQEVLTTSSTTGTGVSSTFATTESIDGENLILPGVRLPFRYSRSYSRGDGPDVLTTTGSAHQVLLINRGATSALTTHRNIASVTDRQRTYWIVSKGVPTEGDSNLPPALVPVNQLPCFSAVQTGTDSIELVTGTITIPVNIAIYVEEFVSLMTGTAVVFAVQQEGAVKKAVGTIAAFPTEVISIPGASAVVVTGVSVDVSSVVRTEFDTLATPAGTLYTNNGSVRGLFNANPSFIDTLIEPPFFGEISFGFMGGGFRHNRFHWIKNTVYVVNTQSSAADFGTSRKHYADIWKIDRNASPVTFTKQNRCAAGEKKTIFLQEETGLGISEISGSYWP